MYKLICVGRVCILLTCHQFTYYLINVFPRKFLTHLLHLASQFRKEIRSRFINSAAREKLVEMYSYDETKWCSFRQTLYRNNQYFIRDKETRKSQPIRFHESKQVSTALGPAGEIVNGWILRNRFSCVYRVAIAIARRCHVKKEPASDVPCGTASIQQRFCMRTSRTRLVFS